LGAAQADMAQTLGQITLRQPTLDSFLGQKTLGIRLLLGCGPIWGYSAVVACKVQEVGSIFIFEQVEASVPSFHIEERKNRREEKTKTKKTDKASKDLK
jgi:hypothetical protein